MDETKINGIINEVVKALLDANNLLKEELQAQRKQLDAATLKIEADKTLLVADKSKMEAEKIRLENEKSKFREEKSKFKEEKRNFEIEKREFEESKAAFEKTKETPGKGPKDKKQQHQNFTLPEVEAAQRNFEKLSRDTGARVDLKNENKLGSTSTRKKAESNNKYSDNGNYEIEKEEEEEEEEEEEDRVDGNRRGSPLPAGQGDEYNSDHNEDNDANEDGDEATKPNYEPKVDLDTLLTNIRPIFSQLLDVVNDLDKEIAKGKQAAQLSPSKEVGLDKNFSLVALQKIVAIKRTLEDTLRDTSPTIDAYLSDTLAPLVRDIGFAVKAAISGDFRDLINFVRELRRMPRHLLIIIKETYVPSNFEEFAPDEFNEAEGESKIRRKEVVRASTYTPKATDNGEEEVLGKKSKGKTKHASMNFALPQKEQVYPMSKSRKSQFDNDEEINTDIIADEFKQDPIPEPPRNPSPKSPHRSKRPKSTKFAHEQVPKISKNKNRASIDSINGAAIILPPKKKESQHNSQPQAQPRSKSQAGINNQVKRDRGSPKNTNNELEEWKCLRCNAYNKPYDAACAVCHVQRQTAATKLLPPKPAKAANPQ